MLRSILAMCLLALLCSCGSPAVRFGAVSPYSPLFTRPGWVAIVRPGDIQEEYAKIDQAGGGFMDRAVRVYWPGAVDAQAAARFRRCFAGGVVLMDEGEAVEMERMIQSARAEGAVPGHESRAWREAIDRARAASLIDPSDPAARRAADNARNPPAVVLRITEASLSFEDRRPAFRMRARAIEPLTTRVLLDEPYSTQGRTLVVKSDTSAFGRDVHEAVSDAINGAMIALARDLNAELSD